MFAVRCSLFGIRCWRFAVRHVADDRLSAYAAEGRYDVTTPKLALRLCERRRLSPGCRMPDAGCRLPLENQHRVPVTIEPVAARDCLTIGPEHGLRAAEGAHQH